MNPEAAHEDTTEFISTAVAAHQAPLLRYATRLLGAMRIGRAMSCKMGFVKLMAQPREAVDGHVAEWLFTVCRHRALDVLRKEGRMKRFTEGEAAQVPAKEARPGRALEQAETHAALVRLIEGLPEKQQEVVRLKFQNGFSYKEISRITEHSVSYVGVLIHEAVQRLRAEFAAQQR